MFTTLFTYFLHILFYIICSIQNGKTGLTNIFVYVRCRWQTLKHPPRTVCKRFHWTKSTSWHTTTSYYIWESSGGTKSGSTCCCALRWYHVLSINWLVSFWELSRNIGKSKIISLVKWHMFCRMRPFWKDSDFSFIDVTFCLHVCCHATLPLLVDIYGNPR